MIKEIAVEKIVQTVADLCQKANMDLTPDILGALRQARLNEPSLTGQAVLDELLENAELAGRQRIAICQDTGMAVVFVRLGQDLHITGGLLTEAINRGVAEGYRDGYLRASVVADPLERVNTGDNTPAVIHYDVVAGDHLEIIVAPKGFGSENMSAVRLFSPSAGLAGVEDFIIDTVRQAGPNPCPPVIIGIGLGGTLEKVTLLAKQALIRPIGTSNPAPHLAALERDWLDKINRLGIGPAGLGGRTTALAVHIESYPTHIAGLPVALNMGCHATRHAMAVL